MQSTGRGCGGEPTFGAPTRCEETPVSGWWAIAETRPAHDLEFRVFYPLLTSMAAFATHPSPRDQRGSPGSAADDDGLISSHRMRERDMLGFQPQT